MCLSNKKLALIMFLAFFLRILPLISILINGTPAALYENDSDEYIGMGRALSQGDIFFVSATASWFPLFRTPGYPLFLSLPYAAGLNDLHVSFFQIILDCANVLLVFELTKKIKLGEGVAIVSALLYAANPLLISFSFQLLSETFFMFVFLITNVLFFNNLNKQRLNTKEAAVLGILFGFLVWIRPLSMLFPIFYAAFMCIRTKKLTQPALMAGIAYLFVLAWMARNYIFAGTLTYSATLLWSIVCYGAGYVANDPGADISNWGLFIETYSLTDPPLCTNVPFKGLQEGLPVAISFILSNIFVYLKQLAVSSMVFFEPTPPLYIARTFGWWDTISAPYILFYAISAIYQILLYCFAFLGIKKLLKESQEKDFKLLLVFLLLLLIYSDLVVGTVNYHRYRLPFELFIIMIAAYGVVSTPKYARSKERRKSTNTLSAN